MAIINTVEKAPELQLEDETKKPKAKAKVSKAKSKKVDLTEKSLKELKMELQKLTLEVRTGKESNTSLLKRIRKEIARKLTKESNK